MTITTIYIRNPGALGLPDNMWRVASSVSAGIKDIRARLESAGSDLTIM